MEVPFSNDACNSDSPDASNHTPGPDPYECDKEDQPASIRLEMEDPGIFSTVRRISIYYIAFSIDSRMTPITYQTKPDHQCEEGY